MKLCTSLNCKARPPYKAALLTIIQNFTLLHCKVYFYFLNSLQQIHQAWYSVHNAFKEYNIFRKLWGKGRGPKKITGKIVPFP